MSLCSLCGKEFDGRRYHMIYAFAGEEFPEPDTHELCIEHTNRMSELLRSEGMETDTKHAVRMGVYEGKFWFQVDGIGAQSMDIDTALRTICKVLGQIKESGHPLEFATPCGGKATIDVRIEGANPDDQRPRPHHQGVPEGRQDEHPRDDRQALA